jgi:carbon monoxide dehydrogenase subunit G
MDIQGEKILHVPRSEVWRALNTPAILQRCLAGCDTFTPDGENTFRVSMQATVGPVRARFSGKLALQDVVPPSAYALAFEGSGGVAGFGKGTARVSLQDVAQGTRLTYSAQAQVGGRLAQIGERLIEGVTRRMADDFFTRFVRELGEGSPGQGLAETSDPAMVQPATQSQPASTGEGAISDVGGTAPAVKLSTLITVIAAAVSVTAAATAVLAAVIALQTVH